MREVESGKGRRGFGIGLHAATLVAQAGLRGCTSSSIGR